MKKRLMAITFASWLIGNIINGIITVFAATDGGSVAGKTSLWADATLIQTISHRKTNIRSTAPHKNIHSWYDAIKTGVDAPAVAVSQR